MQSLLHSLICIGTLLAAATSVHAQEGLGSSQNEGMWIADTNSLVVVPKSRKTIAAYSVPKAVWAHVKFDTPLPPAVNVVVSGDFVAFQTKTSVYAFSAATAIWCRQDLKGKSPGKFYVAINMIRVRDGDLLYVFGVNSKAWSGVSLATGEELSPK